MDCRIKSGNDANNGISFSRRDRARAMPRHFQKPRHCEERSDEAIHNGTATLDCFAEPAIGPATSGRTRWLAMTLREQENISPDVASLHPGYGIGSLRDRLVQITPREERMKI